VDDCLFFSKKMSTIDNVLADIERLMPRTCEATVNAFLGVQLQRSKKSYILTQPKLYVQVIKATNMIDCIPSCTPTSSTPVGADSEGECFDEEWEYASIVGMLTFLANDSYC
jgi:hypothetical protein